MWGSEISSGLVAESPKRTQHRTANLPIMGRAEEFDPTDKAASGVKGSNTWKSPTPATMPPLWKLGLTGDMQEGVLHVPGLRRKL